jgi:hypothetical protein
MSKPVNGSRPRLEAGGSDASVKWANSQYSKLLPTMQSAAQLSAASFRAEDRALIHASSVDSFKVFHAGNRHVRRFLQVIKTSSRADAMQALDLLLAAVVPHLRLHNRALGLDDLYVHDLTLSRGEFSRAMHWDGRWWNFPGADGFNVWFLVEPAQRELQGAGEGNMFLAPGLASASAPPQYWASSPDGGARWGSQPSAAADDTYPEPVQPPTSSQRGLKAAGLKHFLYLNMTPGDCLVFTKRTAHFGDPRPAMRGMVHSRRLAVTARVLVRPENSRTAPFWMPKTASDKLSEWASQAWGRVPGTDRIELRDRHALTFRVFRALGPASREAGDACYDCTPCALQWLIHVPKTGGSDLIDGMLTDPNFRRTAVPGAFPLFDWPTITAAHLTAIDGAFVRNRPHSGQNRLFRKTPTWLSTENSLGRVVDAIGLVPSLTPPARICIAAVLR